MEFLHRIHKELLLGRLKRVLFVREEQILYDGVLLERCQEVFVLIIAIEFELCRRISVREDQPDALVTVSTKLAQILDPIEIAAGNGPDARFRWCAVGTGEESLVGKVRELLEMEAVVQSRECKAHMVDRLKNVANGIARVTMIKTIPVVLTASKRFIEREVEVLRGAKLVASVGLPRKGGRHRLAAENIVIGGVVEHIHRLFFTLEKLHG